MFVNGEQNLLIFFDSVLEWFSQFDIRNIDVIRVHVLQVQNNNLNAPEQYSCASYSCHGTLKCITVKYKIQRFVLIITHNKRHFARLHCASCISAAVLSSIERYASCYSSNMAGQEDPVQREIHQDWANREYIEVITSSIKKIADFLNSFDMSCRSRLATLNEKLTALERRIEYIEARVTKGETLTQSSSWEFIASQTCLPTPSLNFWNKCDGFHPPFLGPCGPFL